MKCVYEECQRISEEYRGQFIDDGWGKYWTCDECEANFQEMDASQVAEILKSQGFRTEVLGDDTVLVSRNRKISTMEVEAALPGYSVQSASGKVKVYI